MYADDSKIYREIRNSLDYDALQNDLNNIINWSIKWKLPVNSVKCYSMSLFSKSNRIYTINGIDLTVVNRVKDLGLIYTSELSFDEYIVGQVRKANNLISIIRKSFASLTSEEFSILYKSYIRPLLEYNVTLWSPRQEYMKNLLEKTQRRATRLIHNSTNMSYESRLRFLKLGSLENRRQRGDMIEIYKLITGVYGSQSIVQLRSHSYGLRMHDLYLAFPFKPNSEFAKSAFPFRAIETFNKLPISVINNSSNVNTFKNNYDNYLKETL